MGVRRQPMSRTLSRGLKAAVSLGAGGVMAGLVGMVSGASLTAAAPMGLIVALATAVSVMMNKEASAKNS